MYNAIKSLEDVKVMVISELKILCPIIMSILYFHKTIVEDFNL